MRKNLPRIQFRIPSSAFRISSILSPSYVTLPLAVFLAMGCVAAFTGQWPWADHFYDSYLLQARSWLEGRLDLGQDYAWLELAIYEGKYYVSFPPFPSYVLLPFAAIWGEAVKDSAVAWAVTLLGVGYAVRLYELIRRDGKEDFWVLFLYLGTGYLFISMNSYVWFFAQTLCFTLSLMAIVHAIQGQGGWSLGCWAAAVGCRPMVIVYLPLLFWLLWKTEEPGHDILGWIKRRWYWAIAPCALALSYMALNWARFGNPIEFGHNYLPEFTLAEHGQFSLQYVWKNLLLLLRLPGWRPESNTVWFYTGDTMAFWLVNPMYICVFAAFASTLRRKEFRGMAGMLLGMFLVHVFILCAHKTLGAWQFGNRYMVDTMPWLFCGLLLWMPQGDGYTKWSMPLFAWGAALNLIGAAATYSGWI